MPAPVPEYEVYLLIMLPLFFLASLTTALSKLQKGQGIRLQLWLIWIFGLLFFGLLITFVLQLYVSLKFH